MAEAVVDRAEKRSIFGSHNTAPPGWMHLPRATPPAFAHTFACLPGKCPNRAGQ